MAIALVQSNTGTSTLATVTAAFSVAPTSGNLVVLAFASDDYNATPNAGWTQSAEMEQQTFHGSYLWWRISDGSNSLQYTIGSATGSAWVLMEFSGVDASPYDISQGQFVQGGGLTSYTTDTITPTTGNRVLIAAMGGSGSGTTMNGAYTSWLNSFTPINNTGTTTGTTKDCMGTAYRLVTGNGSTAFSSGASYPDSCSATSGLIISFKEAGDVPGTITALGGSYAIAGTATSLEPSFITRIGTPGTGTTTAVFPTHQAGDLLLVYAFRDGNATPPALPAGGWATVTTATTTSASARLGFLVATGSGTASGTWTSATSTIAAVYRGIDQSDPIGGSAASADTTATATYPAVTMQTADGTSWVVGFSGHRSTDTAINTAPTGMSNWTSVLDATDEAAIHDTNAPVSAWSQQTVALGGTASGHCQIMVEIRRISGPRILTAVSGSYAATGTAADLERGRKVITDGSTYALGGTASTLKLGRTAVAAGGSHVIVGTDAGIRLGRKVTAAGGSYAVSGTAATLAHTVARTLIADAGSYALAGSDAVLSRPPLFRSLASTSYGLVSSTICNAPAGVVDGDILIAGIFVADGDPIPDDTLIPPAGWTRIGIQSEVSGGGLFANFYVYWKRAASEGANYTFGHVGSLSYTTQAEILAYSGCIASGSPVDTFSQNAASTGSTATYTGITTTVSSAKLVLLGHNWDGTGALTPPTGTTERFDHIAYSADEDWLAAGATGNRTQSLASSNPWAAFLIALKPGIAAVSYPLTANGGSYVLTGADAAMEIAVSAGLVAGAGSYALAGADAALAYSGEILPPVFRSVASIDYAVRVNTIVAKPTGVVDGDILIAGLVLTHGSPFIPGDVPMPPAGWTEVGPHTEVVDGTGFHAHFYAWWHRASGDGADYTFSHLNHGAAAVIVAYHDAFTAGNPIDVVSRSLANSGATATYAGVTTTDPSTKLVLVAHNWDGTGTLTPPGGMVERFDGLVYAADEDRPNIEATGDRTQGLASSNPWAGFLIGLKPAIVGTAFAAPGFYALAGSDAVVEKTDGRAIFARGGSYGLSGETAFTGRGLIVAGGSYSIAGSAALFIKARIAAEAGSYVLSGTAAALLKTGEEEIPVTPIIGGGGAIPKKQMRRAVRELLKREEKRKGRKKPKVLAREILEAIEAKGLGVQEKRLAARLIGEALRLELPSLFYSQPIIRDKGEIARAILFLVSQAMQRIADEEEDEEAALLLLSAA